MALKLYPNGLKLSVIPKKDAKLTTVDLFITSGTQSETNYESGVSEFLSRMFLMGTNKHPSNGDLISYAKSRGVLLSSDNTSESITVTATTVSENVDFAIELLTEIAFDSRFSIEGGDKVRISMLGDIARLSENPSYILERMVNQALFYRTGLSNPKFGTNTTISRMTAINAKNFCERVLTPKNTVISVVGDVDIEKVYEKVMQTFYARFLNGGEYKKLKYVANIEEFAGGERTKNKKLNQSRIFLAFPSISYKNSKKYVLNIIAPIVERSIKNQLSRSKYFHDETITTSLYANNGKLTIECMVDYEYVNEYVDDIVETLKDITDLGISEQAFENEKNAYVIKFLQENERAGDLSKNACREVAINKQSYSLPSELLKVELLTVSDANRIAREIFDFTRLYIAYLGNPVELNALDYV